MVLLHLSSAIQEHLMLLSSAEAGDLLDSASDWVSKLDGQPAGIQPRTYPPPRARFLKDWFHLIPSRPGQGLLLRCRLGPHRQPSPSYSKNPIRELGHSFRYRSRHVNHWSRTPD
jgi:hypothetical protein